MTLTTTADLDALAATVGQNLTDDFVGHYANEYGMGYFCTQDAFDKLAALVNAFPALLALARAGLAAQERRCETCEHQLHGERGPWCDHWWGKTLANRDVMCADIRTCGAWSPKAGVPAPKEAEV